MTPAYLLRIATEVLANHSYLTQRPKRYLRRSCIMLGWQGSITKHIACTSLCLIPSDQTKKHKKWSCVSQAASRECCSPHFVIKGRPDSYHGHGHGWRLDLHIFPLSAVFKVVRPKLYLPVFHTLSEIIKPFLSYIPTFLSYSAADNWPFTQHRLLRLSEPSLSHIWTEGNVRLAQVMRDSRLCQPRRSCH